ncbi:DNA-binding transcriptional regulator, AcrR family [Maribacter dokdonensis]|uniref:DNA-binding transcriptional regulator, AcrR family n=1 Tax=Maribacter dokdonensis TaxID=320912 RepID=A0ABY0UMN3_9FLAO|nr:TetR/AcrR family transcriptional regulator [Maribacter dokdonensis]SDS92416.1 DNA-binding transcriptional regulator, AcrR family [Maribacter dokdonensis]
MIRSEKTRQFIIEKTASIFNKKGYVGTYLSDITKATGLTKGSIYGNFKDKNEVALEAFRYNYAFQSEGINEKIKLEERSVDKLIAFLNHYKVEYKSIFENGGCAILNTAIDADDGNIILKDEVTKSIENWITRISQILEDGIQKKELKKVDTMEFSTRMVALIEGSIMLSKTLNQSSILLKNIEFIEEEINSLIVK